MHMSENPTSKDASSLTKKELIRKQRTGTLTREEEIQFLITVRGMLPKDAERMVSRPPRNIMTKDITHFGQG